MHVCRELCSQSPLMQRYLIDCMNHLYLVEILSKLLVSYGPMCFLATLHTYSTPGLPSTWRVVRRGPETSCLRQQWSAMGVQMGWTNMSLLSLPHFLHIFPLRIIPTPQMMSYSKCISTLFLVASLSMTLSPGDQKYRSITSSGTLCSFPATTLTIHALLY